jgi:hypothetical protein
MLLSGCVDRRGAAGFEARVYEVQLHADQSSKLDAAKLNARAARGEDIGEILSQIGATKLLYRMCQPMGYNGDGCITLRSRVPMITNTRTGARSSRINTIQYQLVGPDFKVFTQPPPDQAAGKVQVRLNADMTLRSPSSVETTSGVSIPANRRISLNCNNLAKVGERFVVASVSSNAGDTKGSSTAYVCSVSVAPNDLPATASPTSAPTTRPASGPSTADFQAAIYRLEPPADRIGGIDVSALSRPSDAQRFTRQLDKLGQAKLLHQASQPVSLTSESVVEIEERKPFVTGSRTAANGERINTVQYQRVGAVFRLSTAPISDPAAKSLRVRLEMKLSEMTESKLEITKGVPAPIILQGEFIYAGNLDIGRPFVGVCFDASSCDKDDDAVAYIYRVVLSNLR